METGPVSAVTMEAFCGGMFRFAVKTVAKIEASIISDISTLREPQESIQSLKTSIRSSSSLGVEDENLRLENGLKDGPEAKSGNLLLNQNSKPAPDIGMVEHMRSSSELRAIWVKQRCSTLKSKILIKGRM